MEKELRREIENISAKLLKILMSDKIKDESVITALNGTIRVMFTEYCYDLTKEQILILFDISSKINSRYQKYDLSLLRVNLYNDIYIDLNKFIASFYNADDKVLYYI